MRANKHFTQIYSNTKVKGVERKEENERVMSEGGRWNKQTLTLQRGLPLIASLCQSQWLPCWWQVPAGPRSSLSQWNHAHWTFLCEEWWNPKEGHKTMKWLTTSLFQENVGASQKSTKLHSLLMWGGCAVNCLFNINLKLFCFWNGLHVHTANTGRIDWSLSSSPPQSVKSAYSPSSRRYWRPSNPGAEYPTQLCMNKNINHCLS